MEALTFIVYCIVLHKPMVLVVFFPNGFREGLFYFYFCEHLLEEQVFQKAEEDRALRLAKLP